MEFYRIEIDEYFAFGGRKFQKKTASKAVMLSSGQLKEFFQFMPVQPLEATDVDKGIATIRIGVEKKPPAIFTQ